MKQRKTVQPHGLHRILHSDCPLEYDSKADAFLKKFVLVFDLQAYSMDS